MKQKDLFRKLEKTLDEIDRSEDTLATLAAILRRLVADFREALGLTGGRIYVRENDCFVLRTAQSGAVQFLGLQADRTRSGMGYPG